MSHRGASKPVRSRALRALLMGSALPRGATLSKKPKPQPVLVGSGLLTFSKPGTARMKVTLTPEAVGC